MAYEALCAHQSAMNRAWTEGRRLKETHSAGEIAPFLARMYPAKPETSALPPITKNSLPIGLIRVTADSFGREPARAATASKMPRNVPTHQVAIIPHPKANNVGDCVAKTGGWKTVKYSTQMRTVN